MFQRCGKEPSTRRHLNVKRHITCTVGEEDGPDTAHAVVIASKNWVPIPFDSRGEADDALFRIMFSGYGYSVLQQGLRN